ncbi:PH domain-containing protein [Candidatus Altiarchaeota archaeon]
MNSKGVLFMERFFQASQNPNVLFAEDGRVNPVPYGAQAYRMMMYDSILRLLIISCIFVPLLVLLPVTLPLAAWYSRKYLERFQFALDKDTLYVRKGVFLYSYTITPYRKIQDVNIVQDYMDKPFSLYSLVIYSATIGGMGATPIPGLTREDAEGLRHDIIKKIRRAKIESD